MTFIAKPLRFLLIAVAGALLLASAGCKNTYKETSTFKSPPVILPEDRVFVAMPFDALFKGKVMFKSGKNTAVSIADAFGRYGKAVFVSKQPQGLTESMESAKSVRAQYLVYPTLLKWEDRSTEWSGRRDRLLLRLDLIDMSSGQTVYSRTITGRGKWMTEGGDTPTDLLDEPVELFANDLYQHHETPSALQ
jgi:hypothetical protein